MSKTKHYHNKNIFTDYEEDERPVKRKVQRDKRKERRIERALKTKNIDEILLYDETIVEEGDSHSDI